MDDPKNPGKQRRDYYKPGKPRLDDEARRFQRENFGSKTDLDLRTEGECLGMKGSPLGQLVAGFAKYPGATARERAEGYVKSLGFTDADIAKVREILLEAK